MKEFKGTPGPWTIEQPSRINIEAGSHTFALYAGEAVRPIWIAEIHFAKSFAEFNGKEECKANAKLISASKQMLEALQILTEYFEWLTSDLNFPAYIQAKAALSAALD